MRTTLLGWMLCLCVVSTAFAATDEETELAPEKPAPMRHVITLADHDAAVKAEEARQHASEQATAAPAPARPAAKDAPVAKASKPVLVPGRAAPPAAAKKKAHLAKVGAPAKKIGGKKPLVAKATKR